MSKKITKAQVIGKSQNRTALGMMAAFVAMHPSVTAAELRTKFPKSPICPDAGIDHLFYTESEFAEQTSDWFVNGNACFTKDGEWLTLGNGQKVAFNKVWTSGSLERLQAEMAKFGITGSVGTVSKSAPAGYEIRYEYAEEKKGGIPMWFWLIIIILAVVGYAVTNMMAG